jgi:hypothetical protein
VSNIVITNVDLGSVILAAAGFRDELLTFAGEDTFVEGTLLARQSVNTAITPSAVTGTGNGTVTAASVVAGTDVPIPGNWVLRCVAAATNGGTFRLEDPNGKICAAGLVLTGGSGGANIFEAAGMIFTINDGGTDFAVGDTFTLPVVANGKLVPFNPAGAGGAQRPIGVLTYNVYRASAGDTKVRAMVSGTVNKRRLIIDADGNGTNITAAILDELRSAGILAVDSKNLAALDNQP